jgi:hypothetical protein
VNERNREGGGVSLINTCVEQLLNSLRYQCTNIPLESFKITTLSIFHKIKWESFLWGVGTSLGELPPYFIARTGKSQL